MLVESRREKKIKSQTTGYPTGFDEKTTIQPRSR